MSCRVEIFEFLSLIRVAESGRVAERKRERKKESCRVKEEEEKV